MAVYTVTTGIKTKDLKTTLDAVDSGGKTLVTVTQTSSNNWVVISKQ